MSDLHALMDIAPGVRTLVDTCAGVKAGERVLIVTDTGMDQGIVARSRARRPPRWSAPPPRAPMWSSS
jgi:hypothetical protein